MSGYAPKDTLYLIARMDCERIASLSPMGGGPETWDLSERSIKSFTDILLDMGMTGVLAPMPETASEHRDLMPDLEEKGFELAIQLHPTSFRDLSYDKPLGLWDRETQRKILEESTEDFAEAAGKPPSTYVSGFVSGNDYTFPLLSEIGYRQCSCSKPERNSPKVGAVWVGAFPYAHRTSEKSRLICGDLDLYEIPITSDIVCNKFDIGDPMDLRPDGYGVRASLKDYSRIIDRNIERMLLMECAIKTIVMITHNTIDFHRDFRKDALRFVLDYTRKAAGEHGLEFESVTFEKTRLIADSIDAF